VPVLIDNCGNNEPFVPAQWWIDHSPDPKRLARMEQTRQCILELVLAAIERENARQRDGETA
jgi:hypothetical protein